MGKPAGDFVLVTNPQAYDKGPEAGRLRKTIVARVNFDGLHVLDKPGLSGPSGFSGLFA